METDADDITEVEDAEIPTPFAVSLGSSAGGMIQVLAGCVDLPLYM